MQSQPDSRPQGRIAAIDLVRVLAMALMIEGHTLDALLSPIYQQANWYDVWLFCRGFTAPTFMMLSGFSFALASTRHWAKHLSFTPTMRRRVFRFAFFLLLGYAMHFPVHSIRELQWMGIESWRSWLQVDVLQTIGASLLLLQALVYLTRTPERFGKVSLALAAAIVLVSPSVWASGWSSHLRLGVAAYLDGSTGSPFPLLPWTAYLLLGAGIGCLYVRFRRPDSLTFARLMLLAGCLFAITGFGLQSSAMAHYGEALFWKTSPTLFLVRSGVVLSLIGGMLQVARVTRFSSTLVQTLAQESLFVYFVHVCILYGSIWNPGLRQHFAGLDPARALAVAALLIASMLALALSWGRFKQGRPAPVLAFRAAVGLVAAWSLM